jgi:hypothetical protein
VAGWAVPGRFVQVNVGLDAKLSWHGVLGKFSKVELDQLHLLHHRSPPAHVQKKYGSRCS